MSRRSPISKADQGEAFLLLTGTSGEGVHYKNMECVLATFLEEKDGIHIKVWPVGEYHGAEGGKVWFCVEQLEFLEVLSR